MKSAFFMVGFLTCLLFGSCQKNEKSDEKHRTATLASKEIVQDTVTNQESKTLVMVFDNARQSATLVWQNETIALKQDLLASGMKYSNATYELTEHQGTLTLSKGRRVVFSHKK